MAINIASSSSSAWYFLHQLFVFCPLDKNNKGKRDVFIIMVSQHGVQLIQLSMKLSWHIQAADNKIFRAESVTFTDFYVLPTENIGKQQ